MQHRYVVRILNKQQLTTYFFYYKYKKFINIKSFGIKVYPNARATTNFQNKYIEEIINWEPDIINSHRMANNARKVAERYSEKNFGRQVEDVYLNQLLESGIFMTQQGNYALTLSN